MTQPDYGPAIGPPSAQQKFNQYSGSFTWTLEGRMALDYTKYSSTEKEADLKKYLDKRQLVCVVCTDPIPEIRMRRRAVTCCQEHSTLADQIRRALRTTCASKCRLCSRPATPDEVEEFREWRRAKKLQEKQEKKGTKKQKGQEEHGTEGPTT